MTQKTEDDNQLYRAEDMSFLGFRRVVNAFGTDRAFPTDMSEHPYSAGYYEILSLPVERYDSGYWRGSSTSISTPSFGWGALPWNEALSGVYDKLLQSNFNLGVFLGEFKETVRFITDSVSRIAKAIALAKKGNLLAGAKVLAGHKPGQSLANTAGDQWLMFKYALIPLLSDIKGAYELLTKTYEDKTQVRHCVKRPLTAIQTESFGIKWKNDNYILVEYRGYVYLRVSLADRLGLTDPVSIAWELTRLSFVVDWLLPIGNFLKAINARNKLSFHNSLAYTRAGHERFHSPKASNQWTRVSPDAQANAYCYQSSMERAFATSMPVTVPTIQNPLGLELSKYVSAVALLGQAVRR